MLAIDLNVRMIIVGAIAITIAILIETGEE
jgi:FtsZ-interacting cell division protein ZipA